ncbi:hypothetical protein D3C71_1313680 [compost metagenome]
MNAAVASPPMAWPNWPRPTRPRPNSSCRSTPTRSSSAPASRPRCCTRWRCGRWRPTAPNRRAASTRCPIRPMTSACTNGARARRCRAATGHRRWPRSARWAPPSAAIRAGAISRRACWRRPASAATPSRCTARRRVRPPSTASWPPTSSASPPTRCARGNPTTAPRRRRRSHAIRRSSARWSCSRSSATAGPWPNGTMR